MAGPSISAATPGLSRLAQALAGGGSAYQRGYDDEVTAQTKIAQALASIRSNDASAAFHNAKAGQTQAEQRVLEGRPDLFEEQVAAASGSDVPLVRAIREKLRTGQAPQVPMGPETVDGQMGVGSQQFDPQTANKITGALQQFLPMLTNTGDLKPDDMAKAAQLFRESDLSDRIIAGNLDRNRVGGAQAAVSGKDLFNSDANGAVLDRFTGALDTANPMAQSTIQVKKEQAGAQRASAANSYASAGEHRARTGEIQTGMSGGGKAPTGYRWNGGALEPIPGGPADPATKGAKLAKPPTEGQAKALMFGARMAVADETLGDLEKQGNRLPNVVKQGAEKVPLIGSALGMGANFFTTDGQQQVEQAQRDFINAVLRRESGAAIAESEFANAQRQYFAQPGDSPAVLRQKAANRQTAIAGMKAEFGEQSLPEFEKIVSTARAGRKPVGTPTGGASGDFGAPTGRNVTVDY